VGGTPSPVQAERSSGAAEPQQLLDSRLGPRCRFHKNGRPIRQNFRDPLHHFGGIVAGADHGVASDLRRVLQHQVERFGARLLAEIGQQRDVAADQRLQPRSMVPKMDRDRTTIPRTTPSVRTTRKPSSSNCVVTMLCWTIRPAVTA